MVFLFFYTILGLIFGFFTSLISKKKGYSPATWFLIGFIFGIIGLLVAIGLPKRKEKEHVLNSQEKPKNEAQDMVYSLDKLNDIPIDLYKKCPECGELIRIDAKICRYCNRKFSDDEIKNSLRNALNREDVKANEKLFLQVVNALAKLGDDEALQILKKKEKELKDKERSKIVELAFSKLQKMSSVKVKNFAMETENGWLCICGTENPKTAKNCKKCHAAREYVLKYYTKEAMINLVLKGRFATKG